MNMDKYHLTCFFRNTYVNKDKRCEIAKYMVETGAKLQFKLNKSRRFLKHRFIAWMCKNIKELYKKWDRLITLGENVITHA